MSIVPPKIPVLNPNLLPPPIPQEPNGVVSEETSHFNYPGSDLVIRSRDSYNFPLPKIFIVICSPVLRNLIESVSNSSDVPNGEEHLPVVNIPESKETLYNLLTFIFPVTPALPPTAEKIMELLAVAQKYEMNSVVSHIRGAICRQDPPFLRSETALHIYFLAQQYGLHHEAVQAARVTLGFRMTIEGLGDKLDFPGMTGAYLHELWKYHEQVRNELKSAVPEFRKYGLLGDMTCRRPPQNDLFKPRWLYDYMDSVAGTPSPHLLDLTEFENAWARHVQTIKCYCASMSSQVKRSFWKALMAIVCRTLENADSTLTLVKAEHAAPPSVPLCLDMPDANIVVRSSDQANFRVHKSVLAMSSPFFKDLLSLPQPSDHSDGEFIDGLPVVALPEDTDLLNSLISLLYPISLVIPKSYQKVFALLAVCQKYEMESVQFIIRTAIKAGEFPAPVKAEGFSAYAIASGMGLVSEAEDAARLTLGQPMTFEWLGEGLRLFKGRALYDLIRYRDEYALYP